MSLPTSDASRCEVTTMPCSAATGWRVTAYEAEPVETRQKKAMKTSSELLCTEWSSYELAFCSIVYHPSSRRRSIGAKIGTGFALFPLLPTAGWEKVPIAGKLAQPAQARLRGRMRARAKRGSCRLHHRRAFSAPALIR